MKYLDFYFLFLIVFLNTMSCDKKHDSAKWQENSVETVAYQMKMMSEQITDSNKIPRSIKENKIRLENLYDWTSGFFPGSLWYTYELTNDDYYKNQAIKFTTLLQDLRNYKDTHDLGFMVYCSYGNMYRITQDTTAITIMLETADNLMGRFNNNTQTIRSWDFGDWQYPVIIDNMMNLELLFWASEYTNDSTYKRVAIKHANTTMKNHYREDFSAYHVVDYDTISGNIIRKMTHQGYSDDSNWARGQAWGLYGYTVMYRYTKDEKYLEFATKIANFIMENVKTDDLIPYWDYNAPDIPNAPRDASAAAITASALFELSKYIEDGNHYYNYAETILKNLSGEEYLAKKGENLGFILKHSVGHLPANSEIDTPLNYADYYYLEALKRYIKNK